MGDGMTDDDRRWLERRVAQFPPATYASNIESALLAEAARTDDLAAQVAALRWRLNEALTLLADRVERVLDDDFAAFALRGLVKNAGGDGPVDRGVGGGGRPDDPDALADRPAPSGSPAPEPGCDSGCSEDGHTEPCWDRHEGHAAPDWEARARSAEAEVARLRDGIDVLAGSLRRVGNSAAADVRALLDPPGAEQ